MTLNIGILMTKYLKSEKMLYLQTLFENGPVAERLGSALQKLLLRFESGRDLN